MKGKRKLWIALPVAAVVCFIFCNSVLNDAASVAVSRYVAMFLRPVLNPFLAVPNGIYHKMIRKLAHFVEFAVLGGCLSCGVQKLKFKGKWALAVLLVVLIACFDEIIQSFSDSRTNSIFDICIDLAGAVCGMICGNFMKKRGMHHG